MATTREPVPTCVEVGAMFNGIGAGLESRQRRVDPRLVTHRRAPRPDPRDVEFEPIEAVLGPDRRELLGRADDIGEAALEQRLDVVEDLLDGGTAVELALHHFGALLAEYFGW